MANIKPWNHDDAEQIAADIKRLRRLFPIGGHVAMRVVSVSRSGMSRTISVFAYDPKQKEIVNVSKAVARVCGERWNDKDRAVYMKGVGMDMCDALAYDLSLSLYQGSRSKKLERDGAGYALRAYTI